MGRVRMDPWPLHARCPGCGEVTSHAALRVDADGTRHLRCKACGHEWERGRAQARTRTDAERKERRIERETRTCPWCGRRFVPVRNAIWCSADCRTRGRRHQLSAVAALIAQTEQLEREMLEVG